MISILDSHVHFWNPQQLRYTWLDDLPALNRTFLPENLPVAGENWSVDGFIFVQADCLPEQGVQEAQWVAELGDARLQGVVAFASLEKNSQPMLEQLKANPLVKGVRRLIQSEPLGFSTQPAFIEGVKLLAKYDFSFDICVRHHQLPDVLELVRRCHEIHFVLDHIGKPDIKNGQLESWREHITTLAAFPHVHCKISGMVTEADWQHWTPADLQPYIEHVIGAFGVNRVMFGGDYPVVELACPYPRWIETILAAVQGFSSAEKQQFFHDNARNFYRV